ncbi:hypothetical protein IH824_01345 [candidate division KSB1 bacterium]|nr:hypothetical protein [candidate division KSB1 bacterium]
MDNNDRPEFVQVLNGLAAIRRVELTEEAYELWWQSMKDWPLDDFKDAAGYLLLNCQFMPIPYDFEQLRKKGEVSAHEAWSMAMHHVEGPWRQGVLGDALIDRVVAALGGYSVIALTKTDKLGFLERRFLDAYNDLLDTSVVRKALPDLTERPRIQNGSPVRIGEIVKASV